MRNLRSCSHIDGGRNIRMQSANEGLSLYQEQEQERRNVFGRVSETLYDVGGFSDC